MNDKDYLKLAVNQAKNSVDAGGFPAGAIIVKDEKIVAEGISVGFRQNDPSGHAETAAIRAACHKLKTYSLKGATLYESLECCNMCFSVAYWAGISKIVYACRKTPEMVRKLYYEGSTKNEDINKTNNRKIELIFLPDFEADSLAIIKSWEKNKITNMKKGIDYIGVSAGAMIFNHKRELFLAKRSKNAKNERGHWENPGGAVVFGEALEEAVRREIREEYGIEIDIIEQFPAADHIIPKEKQHWLATTFLAKIKPGQTPKILEPDKCDALGWFSLNKLPRPLSIITRLDLKEYHDWRK